MYLHTCHYTLQSSTCTWCSIVCIQSSEHSPTTGGDHLPTAWIFQKSTNEISLNPRACSPKGDDEPVRCQRNKSKSSEKENFTWITATAHVCMPHLHKVGPQPTSTVAKVWVNLCGVQDNSSSTIQHNPSCSLRQINNHFSNCKSIYEYQIIPKSRFCVSTKSTSSILCFHKINFIDFVFPQKIKIIKLKKCGNTKSLKFKLWKHKID